MSNAERQPNAPSATITRTSPPVSRHSAVNQGAQVNRSAGVGALAGGAHRTAATTRVPLSVRPSAASTLVGELAKPARCMDANSTSPDRSPVNTRPVRLAPWAAGASPTIISRGRSAPHPGTGLPQYGWSANDRRLVSAICSRHSTNRGQARHTDTSASSCAADSTASAIAVTCAGSDATAVRAVAGSPGHPEPGGTGESNSAPVRGWARVTALLCTNAAGRCP
jgi:hypothetical protein